MEEEREAQDDFCRNAPCGCHCLDREGTFVQINDTELAWLGLSRKEIVGRLKLVDVVLPDDRKKAEQAIERLSTGESVRDLEIRLVGKEGSPLLTLANADAAFDESGNFRMSRFSVTDISRQKQAKTTWQALLESEGKYRAVIEAMADGIVLLDLESIVIDCNPSAERILGVPCVKILGERFADLGLEFLREDGTPFPKGKLPHKVTLETKNPCWNVVLGVSKREGETTWVRVDSELISVQGAPYAVMVSFSDISERKRQREELQQSYSALRELSFRLQHAREVERTEVAREIHDELGSTLTSIKFDLSWAVEKSEERAKFEEIFKGLDTAIRSVKKICTALRPSILDDLGLLAAVEWQLGQFGRKTGIRCRIETRGGEPSVPQDVATGMFRIFQETLTNIARHADASKVLVEFHSNGESITLTVTDDGKGIDPKKAAGSKSLGILGMSERAQALGGALSVHPAKPRGTRVVLSIPLERRTSERVSASSIP